MAWNIGKADRVAKGAVPGADAWCIRMADPIHDNVQRGRFELDVSGEIVFANYRRQGEVLAITYVEAPRPLRGKGWSDKLMHGIAETARAEGRKIVPLCGYASAWLRRKKEYRDILA